MRSPFESQAIYIGPRHPQAIRYNRRQFLPKGALLAAGVLGTGSIGIAVLGTGISKAAEYLVSERAKSVTVKNPYLQLIDSATTQLAVHATPEAVNALFIPQPLNPSNPKRIVFRTKPDLSETHTLDLLPSEIKAAHAVRVFGSEYPGSSPDGKQWGQIRVTINGEEKVGGLWFMLSDSSGKPVDPSGNPVSIENRIFAAGTFVTVENTQDTQKRIFPRLSQSLDSTLSTIDTKSAPQPAK